MKFKKINLCFGNECCLRCKYCHVGDKLNTLTDETTDIQLEWVSSYIFEVGIS